MFFGLTSGCAAIGLALEAAEPPAAAALRQANSQCPASAILSGRGWVRPRCAIYERGRLRFALLFIATCAYFTRARGRFS